ncbi:unnamed protein product, partial [Iphiclides podalirius]
MRQVSQKLGDSGPSFGEEASSGTGSVKPNGAWKKRKAIRAQETQLCGSNGARRWENATNLEASVASKNNGE